MEKYNKAKGLENLTCSMLRGNHCNNFDARGLIDYMHKVGIALHNLPYNLITSTDISLEQFKAINVLDPSSSNENWGVWSKELAASFAQNLPVKC